MARGWKRAVERIVTRAGVAGHVERARQPTVVVLAYHNIVPAGEPVAGDSSLHVDQAMFADHLDWLLDRRRIVSLEEAFAESEPEPGGTRVVITFDDAYVGTLTAGAEELAKRGLPATVFVPPGLLGVDGFWWDVLAPPGGEPLDPGVRDHALTTLRGESARIIAWARSDGLPRNDLPAHARPAEAHVVESGEHPSGLRFGAHTWSHPNLARLSRAEIDEELRKSKEWLDERTDRFTNWLAYPYGLLNGHAEASATALFDGAMLVAGGPSVRRGRKVGFPSRVPRVNVPRGLSIEGLALRIAGLVR